MTPTRRAILIGGLASLAGRSALAADDHFAPPAASLARPAAPVTSAAGLEMTDGNGNPVPLSTWAGQVIVLNLWAPWCLPCRREMPSLARLAGRLAGRSAVVLPLAFSWQGASAVRRFYREIGVETLPVLIGDGKNLSATLGIELLPTTVLIDGAANHIATVAGEATWDDAATLAWIEGLA